MGKASRSRRSGQEQGREEAAPGVHLSGLDQEPPVGATGADCRFGQTPGCALPTSTFGACAAGWGADRGLFSRTVSERDDFQERSGKKRKPFTRYGPEEGHFAPSRGPSGPSCGLPSPLPAWGGVRHDPCAFSHHEASPHLGARNAPEGAAPRPASPITRGPAIDSSNPGVHRMNRSETVSR